MRIVRARDGGSSGAGSLEGWLVEPEGRARAGVLLLHGIGDRLEYWRAVQAALAAEGFRSLIFAYSGYGTSGGRTTPEALEGDARAAYGWLCERMEDGGPVFLLAFSLGTGLAAEVAGGLVPAPAGVVLCEAYTTLREAGAQVARGVGFLRGLLPDVWRTEDRVRELRTPLLVVHSDRDELFPPEMARRIARAAAGPVRLEVLCGYGHNAVYLRFPPEYRRVIVDFLSGQSAPIDSRPCS